MWYVIQVFSGRENLTKQMCQTLVKDNAIRQCFIPFSEKKFKYKGKWITTQVVLFPGYLFIETEEKEELFFQLKKVPLFTKVLGLEYEMVALMEEEVRFITALMDENHTVKMSEGIIVGERVVVYEGPLQGREGLIKKVDRRKRLAVLEMELLGRTIDVTVGLEIVAKNEEREFEVVYSY